MWSVSSIQLKAWIVEDIWIPWVRENSPADCNHTSSVPLALLSLKPATPQCRFGLADIYIYMSHFLIINFILWIYRYYWFGFSGEPWLIHHLKIQNRSTHKKDGTLNLFNIFYLVFKALVMCFEVSCLLRSCETPGMYIKDRAWTFFFHWKQAPPT